MTRLFPLTRAPGIADHASRWLSGERWPEAPPRRASTVMLVRDGAAGVEVFLLRRVAQMAFAPSTMVFPGGGVDPRDSEPDLPWSGPSASEWSQRLGCAEAEARMFVAAAVREVFEECGVLLASPAVNDPGGPLADVGDPRWRGIRDGLVQHRLSLTDVLSSEGLVMRTDLIVAKAHWLTPVFEPRRFDTWFFAALMPGHQVADGNTSEADHAAWFDPAQLLEAYADGDAMMMPPTVVCVEQVRDAASANAFVRHADHLPLIVSEIIDTPEGPAMTMVER
ncbi:NUDIX hydrolase [Humibacillus sp. DSM 29435]|uniref:NUDIX hydrolase n=1 Tax=Humibacillus sp. DSM 29435 TaxID=1869167 RepID=UPI000872BBE3|nr:NUDIX domain-containing protein [Humibacillus sp. DSM 29435]OFE18770.1 NUDIX hydrolase [Humibacillus sp. DSM 29435]